MLRHRMIGVVSVVALTLSTAALAQQNQFGTAAEAKAMAAVQADKAKALAMFNKGGGGGRARPRRVADRRAALSRAPWPPPQAVCGPVPCEAHRGRKRLRGAQRPARGGGR